MFYRVKLSLSRVIRGAVWLSVGVIFSNFFGFIYWLIVSRIVEVGLVGKVAAILGIEALIVGFIGLGVSVSVQKFISAAYSRRDYEGLSQYYYSTTTLLFTLSLTVGILLLILSLTYGELFSLDPLSVIFLSILIVCGFNGWSVIGQSFFNAIIKPEYTTLTQVSSSLIRLTISLLLIYLGYGFLGLMMGYVVAGLTTSVLMLALPINMLRKLGARFSLSIKSIRDSVKAGMATWIPNILTLLSQWIGVLGVYSMVGLAETGLYFIAFMIASVAMSLPQSILTLSFPYISGISDCRKQVMARAVKISTSLMAPIAFFLILYPSTITDFIGETYHEASELIRILALGYLVSPINTGYVYYVYAIGRYGDVLIAGLTGTIPRLFLYPIMISLHKDIGAAAAFSIGNTTTLLAVVTCAQRINYDLRLKEYLKIVAIPSAISILLVLFNMHWTGGLASLSTSYVIYTKLKIVTREDLREIGESLVSRKILEKLYPYLRPLLSIIYGS